MAPGVAGGWTGRMELQPIVRGRGCVLGCAVDAASAGICSGSFQGQAGSVAWAAQRVLGRDACPHVAVSVERWRQEAPLPASGPPCCPAARGQRVSRDRDPRLRSQGDSSVTF